MTGDSANDIRIDNVFLERLMDLMLFIKDMQRQYWLSWVRL